jgi:hypothetical protein
MLIFLKAEVNAKYVSASGGGGGQLWPAADYILEYESFLVTGITQRVPGALYSGDTVALQAYLGQYLCAEGGGGGDVVANRTAINNWEQWKLIAFKDDGITPQPNSFPLDPGLDVTHDPGGKPSGLRIGLQTLSGKWVSASSGGNGQLVATVTVYNSWERFQLGYCGGNKSRTSFDGWAAQPAIQ